MLRRKSNSLAENKAGTAVQAGQERTEEMAAEHVAKQWEAGS